MYNTGFKRLHLVVIALLLALLSGFGFTANSCTADGVDYTYIEANAIFGHNASDSGERVYLLSDSRIADSGLAYVDKASGALVETDIIPAYFPRVCGGYVYCQLPSAEVDSANPNKLDIWRFPVDLPEMSQGEKLFSVNSPERMSVSDRIYIECVYNNIASYDLTGGDAREWNGELHIQTTADGEYTLVRLDGKEVCTVGLNPAADYRFNNFMYILDRDCYYVSEGSLYVIRSGEP